jgi:hypothetical protein
LAFFQRAVEAWRALSLGSLFVIDFDRAATPPCPPSTQFLGASPASTWHDPSEATIFLPEAEIEHMRTSVAPLQAFVWTNLEYVRS